jgi:hypothetical protein
MDANRPEIFVFVSQPKTIKGYGCMVPSNLHVVRQTLRYGFNSLNGNL